MKGLEQILMNDNHHKHALIIDDSLDMQELLRLLLESKGYEIDCTSNGEEALELLNSSHRLPNVILLDLRMPVMNGLDFLNLKRESPRLKDIPIIMMTGENDVHSLIEQSELLEIITKPLSMSSILNAVNRNTYFH
jgi:CheY-like chemotaxis protein